MKGYGIAEVQKKLKEPTLWLPAPGISHCVLILGECDAFLARAIESRPRKRVIGTCARARHSLALHHRFESALQPMYTGEKAYMNFVSRIYWLLVNQSVLLIYISTGGCLCVYYVYTINISVGRVEIRDKCKRYGRRPMIIAAVSTNSQVKSL